MITKKQAIDMNHLKEHIECYYKETLFLFNHFTAIITGLAAKRTNIPMDNITFEVGEHHNAYVHAYVTRDEPSSYIHAILSQYSSLEIGIFSDLSMYVDSLFLAFVDKNKFNVINVTFEGDINMVFEVKQFIRRSIVNGSERLDREHQQLSTGQQY